MTEVADKSKTLQPGIYHGTTFADYVSWPAINWHMLSAFRESAKQGRHEMRQLDESTEDQIEGEAFHCAVLEPDRFKDSYAVLPDFPGHHNSNDYKRAVEEWKEKNGSKITLLETEKKPQMSSCLAMRAAVMRHPIGRAIMEGKGKNEIGIVWQDDGSGELFKGRLDRLCLIPLGLLDLASTQPDKNALCLVDFKKTRVIPSRRLFNKERVKYQYHGQFAWYMRGLEALKQPPVVPLLVAVQDCAPFDVAVFGMDSLVPIGKQLCRDYLKTLLACQRSGNWPGISDNVIPLEPYGWEQDPNQIQED